MTKKVTSFFSGKIGITPSVAAPGDTNPSDATVVSTSDTDARLSGKVHRAVAVLQKDMWGGRLQRAFQKSTIQA